MGKVGLKVQVSLLQTALNGRPGAVGVESWMKGVKVFAYHHSRRS